MLTIVSLRVMNEAASKAGGGWGGECLVGEAPWEQRTELQAIHQSIDPAAQKTQCPKSLLSQQQKVTQKGDTVHRGTQPDHDRYHVSELAQQVCYRVCPPPPRT